MADKNFEFVIEHESKILCRDGTAENLSPLIDNDFTEIASNAIIQKKQDVINWIKYGDDSIRTAKNFKARYIAEEVIQLTYTSYIKESPLTAVKSAYRSSIWKKTGDSWCLFFHQATNCQ